MKKYAIVGAGDRCVEMYAIPLSRQFSDTVQIVGVYDPNRQRSEHLQRKAGGHFPVYDGFDAMLNEAKPDIVLVTTIDRYHHEYIIRGLEAGCDVISEKPLTIDAEKCRTILETQRRTGRRVTVTFNMRFMPLMSRLKEIIRGGTIGTVLSVHFEWLLDTRHGADYFRRWHRRKENSGGLLVHKSTHHFDIVNWLLEEEPVAVSAFGTRRFYGPTTENRGERCLTCPHTKTCEFYMDISSGGYKELYLDAEHLDGYVRDRCVFAEEIDIEDSMSVSVKYSGGAVMSYSLTAHSPYEGFKLALNGTAGRVEVDYFSGSVGPYAGETRQNVRIYNRQQEECNVKLPVHGGVHGGGDERLREMIFRGNVPDPLGQQAGLWDGVMSNMIGIAANRSMQEGGMIYVKELLRAAEGER